MIAVDFNNTRSRLSNHQATDRLTRSAGNLADRFKLVPTDVFVRLVVGNDVVVVVVDYAMVVISACAAVAVAGSAAGRWPNRREITKDVPRCYE